MTLTTRLYGRSALDERQPNGDRAGFFKSGSAIRRRPEVEVRPCRCLHPSRGARAFPVCVSLVSDTEWPPPVSLGVSCG